MRDKILLVLLMVFASVLLETAADARPTFRRRLQANDCNAQNLRDSNRPRQAIIFGPLGIPRRVFFTN